MEEKCQCSFWRKCFFYLCCCKQGKYANKFSTSMVKTCYCSIWRRWFCLCKCKQVVEESDTNSDLLIKFVSYICSQLLIMYTYIHAYVHTVHTYVHSYIYVYKKNPAI